MKKLVGGWFRTHEPRVKHWHFANIPSNPWYPSPENGELFIQKVSPEPASRTTIIEKSELLDKKLQEAQVNLVNLDSWTERFILGT